MDPMNRICQLSPPPLADYARIRWPQQMRQYRDGDGYKLCPIRNGHDYDWDMRLLWDYEGPHALSWLSYRGDTARLMPPLFSEAYPLTSVGARYRNAKLAEARGRLMT